MSPPDKGDSGGFQERSINPPTPLNRGVKTKVKVLLTRGIQGVLKKDQSLPFVFHLLSSGKESRQR
jgi:hypothetical protein